MEIETRRLKLIPFTREIIQAAIHQDNVPFARLGIVPTSEWPEPDLMEALPYFDHQITENGITGFNSWLILDKHTHDILGSIGFISEPDDEGAIEIGFGIVPSRRRQGYCEEAARALIQWAVSNPIVKGITAQCTEDNEGSIKVLRKIGFSNTGTKDSLLEWRYTILQQGLS